MKHVALLLALLSFAVIAAELCLTRILAFLLSQQLSLAVMGLALFGCGVGAGMRELSPWCRALLSPRASLAVLAAALLLVVAMLVSGAGGALLGITVAATFVAGGAAIAGCYDVVGAARVRRSYSFDLLGAASACLVTPALIDLVGPDTTLLLLASLLALAASFLREAGGSRFARLLSWSIAASSCLLLALGAAHALPDGALRSPLGAGKSLQRFLRRGGRVAAHQWNALARVDLYEPPEDAAGVIFSDGSNPTLLMGAPQTPAERSAAQRLLPYFPLAIRKPRDVLVLGAGGGTEISLAQLAGAGRIDAVELNPAVVAMVRGARESIGAIYDQPGVRLFVEDGRRFLATHDDRYDVILMTLVLADSAQLGAPAFADAFLYTVEAYREYLAHLVPDGLLAVIDDDERRTVYNVIAALAALPGAGEPEPQRSRRLLDHVAVLHDPRDAFHAFAVLVSPAPLTADQVRAAGWRAKWQVIDPRWIPGEVAEEPYATIARVGVAAFLTSHTDDFTPRSDDSPFPFQFEHRGWPRLAAMWRFVGSACAALVVGAALPLCVPRAVRRGIGGRARLALLFGVAYGLVQICFVQRLSLVVGDAARSVALVLGVLLLSSAIGSRLDRTPGLARHVVPLRALLAATAVAATALAFDGSSMLRNSLSEPVRLFATGAALVPMGMALGLTFPALVRGLPAAHCGPGILWAIAGSGAVAGNLVALPAMIEWGITATVLGAAALYLAGAAAAWTTVTAPAAEP